MKYKTKSAEVLNEADRFEDILNYTLFVQEQDSRLWSGGEGEWHPGDPLPPQEIDPAFELDMEQSFSREDFVMHNQAHVDRFKYFTIRCEDCEVSWTGSEPCWMCGKQEYLDDVRDWLKREMRKMLYEELDLERALPLWSYQQLRHESDHEIEEYRHPSTMRGLRSSLTVIDEATQMPYSRWIAALDPAASDVETNSMGRMLAYTWADVNATRHIYVDFSRRSGRSNFFDYWSEGSTAIELGERPEVCDEPIGTELYDPHADISRWDRQRIRTLLPQDLDLTMRPAINPPVIERHNPTLDRYLENSDRVGLNRLATEQRRS